MTEASQIPAMVGELKGRLDALEGRISGHENGTRLGFESINKKMDQMLAMQNRLVGAGGFARLLAGGMLAAGGWMAHMFWPGKIGP